MRLALLGRVTRAWPTGSQGASLGHAGKTFMSGMRQTLWQANIATFKDILNHFKDILESVVVCSIKGECFGRRRL